MKPDIHERLLQTGSEEILISHLKCATSILRTASAYEEWDLQTIARYRSEGPRLWTFSRHGDQKYVYAQME